MKILQEEEIVRNIYQRLVLDDGFQFLHVSDILGLMEQLENVDSFFNPLIICNMDQEELDKLVSMKVIRKNVKGSYYPTDNYRSFYGDLYKTIYNEELPF